MNLPVLFGGITQKITGLLSKGDINGKVLSGIKPGFSWQ